MLDSFGVDDTLINPVFVGSGLFGSEDEVIGREFRLPPRSWLARNYFHDPADDDWTDRVDDLVALRRAGELRRSPHAHGAAGEPGTPGSASSPSARRTVPAGMTAI